MSSKIEVNRETLEARLTEIMQHLTFAVDRNTIREAIALAAAPVVERQQPFAWFTDDYLTDKSSTTYDELTSARWKDKGWPVQPMYAAPPELAELQATIARLTAENERLQEAHEQVCTNYNKVSYACEERGKEIERLKGGQGEPVAWQLDVEGYKTVTIDNYQRARSEQEHFNGRGRTAVVHNLYRSQPAPVSVPYGWKLVPEVATLDMKNAGWQECERQGIDPEAIEMQTVWTAMHLKSPACLDKVKELNYQGHASDCSTNNRGVPELLGPCDCELSRKPQ